MSKKINYFTLGLFFLAGMTIIIGGLIWLGLSHFLTSSKTYATFFDQSVGGLGPGSGIDYLGVKVGRVSLVKLADHDQLVKVLIQIDQDFKVTDDMATELSLKGITGGKGLSIVKAPGNIKQITPKIDFPVEYPVIPSTIGQIQQIENALEKIYQKVKAVDFEKLASSWQKAAQDVDKLVTSEKVQQTLSNVQEVSSDLQRLLAGLGKTNTSEELGQTLENLSKTADAARKASEVVARQLQGIPPHTISNLADNMNKMVKSSERSINTVKTHIDESMALLQQGLFQMNQVLAEIKELVASLRESPGRILTRPQGGEPFKR